MLVPEVDEKKTIRNAKIFLNKTFDNIRLQAGLSCADLQSPTINDMPSVPPVGNSNERKFVRMITRRDEVRNILKAIYSTSRDSRLILKHKFIDDPKLSDWKIAQQMNYGMTRYKELKNKAFLEFANAAEAFDIDILEEVRKSD